MPVKSKKPSKKVSIKKPKKSAPKESSGQKTKKLAQASAAKRPADAPDDTDEGPNTFNDEYEAEEYDFSTVDDEEEEGLTEGSTDGKTDDEVGEIEEEF